MSNRVIIQAEPREGTVVLTVHDPDDGEHGKERMFRLTADQLWTGAPAEEVQANQGDRFV